MCLEKQVAKSELHEINHANYGWGDNEAIKSLIPVMLHKMSNMVHKAHRRVVKSGLMKDSMRMGKHGGLKRRLRGSPSSKCLN